jgi:release factor H-coupled RctB family protein
MTTVRIIASEKTWIEGDAELQLQRTAELPGMELAVGLPDLHPGKGAPIGAVFGTRGIFYPYLVGNDVGCGMGLWQTGLKARKTKLDRWVRRLDGLDDAWEGEPARWLADRGVLASQFDDDLGTIGGGNHFAELQVVDSVAEPEVLERLELDPRRVLALVHSGSRSLGAAILRHHVDRHRAGGLEDDSDDAKRYLQEHDHAVRWAKANRELIAYRVTQALGTDMEPILDVCHNCVESAELNGLPCWLHRKGAAPSDRGPVVIPGSRGAVSYLVEPLGDDDDTGRSLAHGAGRKWARSDAKGRLGRFTVSELRTTSLGSRVICGSRKLLYEEAPQAYKDIDRVVADLVEAGLCRVVAVLRPLITYKTRRH